MSYRSSSEHRHHRSHSFDRDSGDNWNARRDDIPIVRGDINNGRFNDMRVPKTISNFNENQGGHISMMSSERTISYSPVNMYPRAKMVISQVLGGGVNASSANRYFQHSDEEGEKGFRSFLSHDDIDQRSIPYNVYFNF